MLLLYFTFFSGMRGFISRYMLSPRSCVQESMVLDHSVSQSSENSHSRTQTAEGGRCVYEQRHVGMRQSWIPVVDMSVSCSPSQATENDNTQRNSKDVHNKLPSFSLPSVHQSRE